jgi:hypothetical protein
MWAMRDYWLSKLFFDLQSSPPLGEQYRADRKAILDRYPLAPEVRSAIERDDVAFLAPRVNAYLLRFYFVVIGMPEAEFLSRVRATGAPDAATARHG